MKLRSIKYFFKEGMSGLFKNRLMSMASIAAVIACIFSLTLCYALMANLNNRLGQLEEDIGIVVFLDKDTSADDIQRINNEIKRISYVEDVSYIPPDEALSALSDKWESGGILEGFTGDNNPLSSSFEIKIDGIKHQSSVIDSLQNIEGIRKVRHAATETDLLNSFNKGVKIGGLVVVLLVAILTIGLIVNTIKASIHTRKDEVAIMKLIGATDSFIRWPFVFEGATIGVIGAIIPVSISWLIYERALMLVYNAFPVIKNVFTFCAGIEIFSVIFPVAIVVGVLLGVLGSVMSLRKYLKV